MSCRRHREAIRGAALGEPLPERTRAHIVACAGCRARLDRDRELLGRLEGELRAFSSGEASPELVARVRARLGSVRPAAGATRWWLAAAAVAGLLAAAIALSGRTPRDRRPATPPDAADLRPGEPEVVVTPSPDVRPEPRSRSETATPRVSPSTPPARRIAPEVLVPARDREALRRFAERRHLWRLGAEPVVVREAESPTRWSAADWETPDTVDEGSHQWELDAWPLVPGDDTNGGEGP